MHRTMYAIARGLILQNCPRVQSIAKLHPRRTGVLEAPDGSPTSARRGLETKLFGAADHRRGEVLRIMASAKAVKLRFDDHNRVDALASIFFHIGRNLYLQPNRSIGGRLAMRHGVLRPRITVLIALALLTVPLATASPSGEAADDQGTGSETGPTVATSPEGADGFTETTGAHEDADPCGDRVPHPRISISGEEGVTPSPFQPDGIILGHDPVTGQPIYRPGSGVTKGDGTAENPYVMEDLCIVVPPFPEETPNPFGITVILGLLDAHGIYIEDTTAHIVIRNLYIAGYARGLNLDDSVANVRVEESVFVDTMIGIDSEASQLTIQNNTVTGSLSDGIDISSDTGETTIKGNALTDTCQADYTCAGINFRSSASGVVANNTISGSGATGIEAAGSGTVIEDNVITESGRDGLNLDDAVETLVRRNQVKDTARYGINLAHAERNELHDNIFTNTGSIGVYAPASVDNRIHNNTFWGTSGVGVFFWGSVGEELVDNHIEGYDKAIKLEDLDPQTVTTWIRSNNIVGNDIGLEAIESSTTTDARHNWWGCPDGPDSGDCDPVIGDVLYDPWLTEPNPDAGASI